MPLTFYVNFARFESPTFVHEATYTKDKWIHVPTSKDGLRAAYYRRKKGKPIADCVSLNTEFEEALQNGYRNDLRAFTLGCIENPKLKTLVVGFDVFYKNLEFIIEKALFSGVRVKMVDLSNRETAVFEPLAHFHADQRVKVRYLSPLPKDQQTKPDRTRCEWKVRYDFCLLQWDTLVQDRNGGRAEASLRPELQRIRQWGRENRAFHHRKWDVKDLDSELQLYRRELEETDILCEQASTQAKWDRLIAYGIEQEQSIFEGWQVGDPLTYEALPLLQNLYEAEVDHELTRVEAAQLWIALVWYVVHDEEPTCYNHKHFSQKKWALIGDDEEEAEAWDTDDFDEEEEEEEVLVGFKA